MNILIIVVGKILSKIFRLLNLGNGSTWPGHIALGIKENFVREMLTGSTCKIILIAGTNGKTTTVKLIKTILEKNGKKVFENKSGANLLNGMASTLILESSWRGRLAFDFVIFEVDENALPSALDQLKPDYVLLLNLFRDQLDRYGEVHSIAKKWRIALKKMGAKANLLLNADDPQIAFLGKDIDVKTFYFGLDDEVNKDGNLQQAADSIYCPNCGDRLVYKSVIYSHMGDYICKKCGFARPKLTISKASYALPGLYNKYNSLAAVLVAKKIGIKEKDIDAALKNFSPAFGRQELLQYKGKKVQIFLSKNPTSFNQSFRVIKENGAKVLLIVLNDRIPDGRDVSWIWDVDLNGINEFKQVMVAGDRCYDMALRVKYEEQSQNSFKSGGQVGVKSYEILKEAIEEGIRLVDNDETLFVLPTYSAMLEVRKILTGKKIL